METIEAIKTRRSIKTFLDRPVEFEKVTRILDAGNSAPSAGNLHDWKFVLVTDKALIKLIATHCAGQYWVGEAPIIIVVCAMPEKQELYYGLRGKRLYNTQDTAAATMNMLLAAHALELGSCWIGAFDEAKIAELLSIPRDVRPQAVLPIGYSAEIPPEKRVVELKDVVYFNRFGNRIEFIHRVLKDWSIEWDRALNETATPFIQRSLRRINERFKSLQNNLKDEYQKRKDYRQQKAKSKEERKGQEPLR